MQVFQTYNSTETQKVQTFQSTDFHANVNRLRGMRRKLLSRYMPKCKNCRETFPRVQKLFQLSENFSNCPETCPNVRKLFKLSGNFQTFWKLCKLSRNFLSGKLMIQLIFKDNIVNMHKNFPWAQNFPVKNTDALTTFLWHYDSIKCLFVMNKKTFFGREVDPPIK